MILALEQVSAVPSTTLVPNVTVTPEMLIVPSKFKDPETVNEPSPSTVMVIPDDTSALDHVTVAPATIYSVVSALIVPVNVVSLTTHILEPYPSLILSISRGQPACGDVTR